MTPRKKKQDVEAEVTTAAAYEGNSAPPEQEAGKRRYFNGVKTLILTPQEFEEGGYAMQAFIDRGPVDERIDGAVADAPDEDEDE